jgi:hypothetical protein
MIIDTPMMWACGCGARSFQHYEHCVACGRERPPPPPPKPPSDLQRADVVDHGKVTLCGMSALPLMSDEDVRRFVLAPKDNDERVA